MKILSIFAITLLFGCSGYSSNQEYYKLNSHKGWEAKITPEKLEHYVAWQKAIDRLIENPSKVEAVGQGHSLQVNIVFNDQTYIQTIEPDIDTIFMVLEKCGKPCEHIQQVTE